MTSSKWQFVKLGVACVLLWFAAACGPTRVVVHSPESRVVVREYEPPPPARVVVVAPAPPPPAIVVGLPPPPHIVVHP